MKNILLMDDDKDLAFLTKSVLTQQGYRVCVAHNFNEALTLSKQERFDLMLMDIMLPEMNGGQAAVQLKKEEGCKLAPVIFLSGLVNNSNSLKGEEIVVQGVSYQALGKPYEVNDLINLVRKYLKP